MTAHIDGFFGKAPTALHMSISLLTGTVLQNVKAALAHNLLSLHAFLEISLLFSLDFKVLSASTLIVLGKVFNALLSVVGVFLLLYLVVLGHLFLALELLGEQLLHVLLLLVRVHVLLVQHHVPPTLSSLVLALHIHMSIELWRHMAS